MSRNVVLVCIVITSFTLSVSASLVHWPLAEGGNGHFYEVVSVPGGIVWTDANSLAEQTGGHLATITSEAENDFVFSLIDDDVYWHHFDSGNNHGPWIGGFQQEGAVEPDGGWSWVTGEPFSYSNWLSGEPTGNWGANNEDRLQYSSMSGTREPTWNDLIDVLPDHYAVYAYIVEYETFVSEPVRWSVSEGGNGHIYQGVSVAGGISWTEAKEAAEAAGGYLGTIASQEENDFVFGVINNQVFWTQFASGSNWIAGPWIGGYQPEGSAEPDGGWGWITGEVFDHSAWTVGNPDNITIGECTNQTNIHYMSKFVPGSTWNDQWDNCPGYLPVAYVIEFSDRIIYVDDSATGNNDGLSWIDAFTSLQDALLIASYGDEIWVAQGTYKPDQGGAIIAGDRNATFQLKNGVALYGGFPAGGGYWEDRDPNSHQTVLNGDLSGNDGPDFANNDENSYHVVTGSGTDTTAILDGFTITAGNADHVWNDEPPYDLGIHYGGGMVNSFGSPTVANCIFTGNSSHHGGGMSNYGSSPTITGCTFENNVASSIALDLGYGGAVLNLENSNPILTDCKLKGNSALKLGGAVRNKFSSPTLIDCLFEGNSTRAGGAVHSARSSNPVFTNCVFRVNSADYRAGALENLHQSHAQIIDCEFVGNTAELAGAICNWDGCSPQIVKCAFVGNSAQRGGGIMNYDGGEPHIDGCEFTDNSSILLGSVVEDGGGGIHNDGVDAQITNCTFRENTAQRNGGGILNTNSNPLIEDCTFVENSCTAAGGGIYNVNNSNSSIIGCVFTANSAQRGGGVRNYQDSSPTLANCLFAGNWVEPRKDPDKDAFGGAVASRYSSNPVLINCTLSRNLAVDNNICGGIYSENNSHPTLLNCILWENRQGVTTDEPAQIAGGTPNVDYCSVQGWTGTFGGSGNIGADPLFADPAGGDYHLKSQAGRWNPTAENWLIDETTSPCIDAGSMASPIGPEPFPNGGVINMGAYGGTVEASKSWFGSEPCEIIIAGDINGDCEVNSKDLAIMAFHWLE